MTTLAERLHLHASDLDASGHDTTGGGGGEATDLTTAETDVALSLHPDGAGGVAWASGSGVAGTTTFDPTTTTGINGSLVGTDVQTIIEQVAGYVSSTGHEHFSSEFTGDGVETDFDLGDSFDLFRDAWIYFNGVRQGGSVTYDVNDVAGSAVVSFDVAPANGVVVIIDYTLSV